MSRNRQGSSFGQFAHWEGS